MSCLVQQLNIAFDLAITMDNHYSHIPVRRLTMKTDRTILSVPERNDRIQVKRAVENK